MRGRDHFHHRVQKCPNRRFRQQLSVREYALKTGTEIRKLHHDLLLAVKHRESAKTVRRRTLPTFSEHSHLSTDAFSEPDREAV